MSAVGILRFQPRSGVLEEIPLEEGQTVQIGRKAGNDIMIEDEKVSRLHAAISSSQLGVMLSDLSSLNGTFVNGKRISSPISLHGGEVIKIGDATLTFALEIPNLTREDFDSGKTLTAELQTVIVTILIADIAGYTKLANALPAGDVASILQNWFRVVSGTIEKRGGQVDKYIGDCVMAFWVSESGEEGRAAAAALEAGKHILEETQKLDKTWNHSDKHPWKCRVVLNSGEALIGSLGGDGVRDFTLIGDAVNLVFKLEEMASKLDKDFLIGETAANYLGNPETFTPLGLTKLPNHPTTLNIFSLP